MYETCTPTHLHMCDHLFIHISAMHIHLAISIYLFNLVCIYYITQINVGTCESEQIARSCVPYLSKTVPHSVQRHCLDTLMILAEHNPDTVWLLLVQLCPHLLPSPHHTSLNTIVVSKLMYI